MRGRAVFAGCARDCSPHLPLVLENISRIATLFDETAFVFAENDSIDDTRDRLQSFIRDRPNAQVLALDGLVQSEPVRTVRIAAARNACLDHARANYGGYDWFIMMDLDAVNRGPIDLGYVRQTLKFLTKDPKRCAAFANAHGFYYDIWALRHPTLCPRDVWEDELDAVLLGLSDEQACRQAVAGRVFSIDPALRPIKVDSAFGGLAIYKLRQIMRSTARYDGVRSKTVSLPAPEGGEPVTTHSMQLCEHVPFHAALRANGGDLFIMPCLINHHGRKLEQVVWETGTYRKLLF